MATPDAALLNIGVLFPGDAGPSGAFFFARSRMDEMEIAQRKEGNGVQRKDPKLVKWRAEVEKKFWLTSLGGEHYYYFFPPFYERDGKRDIAWFTSLFLLVFFYIKFTFF